MSDAIHNHFGLSYSSYLVLPRSVLQSMPDEWQEEFVDMLKEMEKKFGGHLVDKNYNVYCNVDSDTPLSVLDEMAEVWSERDDLSDYDRGRRRLPENPLRM